MNETPNTDLFRDGSKTVSQTVEKFGIGRTRLYALMDAGRIRFTKLGNRRLIPESEVRRVLAEGLVPETPAGRHGRRA